MDKTELAIGIGFKGNQLTTYVLTQGAEVEAVPLSDLYRRGLPSVARTKPVRRRIDTNFADWKLVGADEYLAAFGLLLPKGVSVEQQFFQVDVGNRRFVIPALALMRALFRPSKHLLPTMFGPQALDQVCRLQTSVEGVMSLVVDARWATDGVTSRHSDWSSPLAWMTAHPSAYAMAGSVHDHAMASAIGVTLPSADARIVFRGIEKDRTMFVTEASVMTVTPSDKPDFQVSGLGAVVILHGGAQQKGGGDAEGCAQFAVPLRADGTHELSDAEWAQIEPIIASGRAKPIPFKHPQRDILDGVLCKLSSGTPWRKVSYKAGNCLNASGAFRTWAARGVLGKMLAVLGESRKA